MLDGAHDFTQKRTQLCTNGPTLHRGAINSTLRETKLL